MIDVMRMTNKKLLNELLSGLGENPREKVVVGTNYCVSATTIFRLTGDTKMPHASTRRMLCEFFKVAEDDLFPLARKKSG